VQPHDRVQRQVEPSRGVPRLELGGQEEEDVDLVAGCRGGAAEVVDWGEKEGEKREEKLSFFSVLFYIFSNEKKKLLPILTSSCRSFSARILIFAGRAVLVADPPPRGVIVVVEALLMIVVAAPTLWLRPRGFPPAFAPPPPPPPPLLLLLLLLLQSCLAEKSTASSSDALAGAP